MGLGNEDKKIVFCMPERQTSHDIGQGFIRPVFEETVDGLKPIDEDVFKNNVSVVARNCMVPGILKM